MIPEKYRYDVLARTVAEVDAVPFSTHEVAVLLEVLGLFKRESLEPAEFFEVSNRIQRLVRFYSAPPKVSSQDKGRKDTGSNIGAFASGMVYSSVWSIMLIALFAGGISLWAAYPEKVGFIPPLATTSVGLGVVISFIATGGVQQIFSLRMSYYRLQDNFPLAKKMAIEGYTIGFLIVVMAAISFMLINAVAALFPLELATYTMLFLILLGVYRILVIPLYAYRKFHLIVIGPIIALVCLYSVFYALGQVAVVRPDYRVLIAQAVGLEVLIAVTAIECIPELVPFKKKARTPRNPSFYQSPTLLRNVRPPRLSIIFFDMLSLFAFGTMFYVFLFFDRLVSWISATGPFLLTYNANYQFGADMALLILIPLTGVIYFFLHGLSNLLETASAATNIADRSNLRVAIGRFVARMFACTGLAAGLFVFALWQYATTIVQMAGGGAESVLVFRVALIAYSFFAFFLANTFISFSFRRYSGPALLLFLATFTELGANTLCPRLISAWNPAYGLLLSVLLVTIIASLNTMRSIQQTHYFYYSAF